MANKEKKSLQERLSGLLQGAQMTLRTQPRQYLTRMTAATESNVYVNAVGLDIQPVDALL